MAHLKAPPDIQRLQRWLSRQGASAPGIRVVDRGPGNRQAVASRRLREGCLVLHLPRTLLMDVAAAQRSLTGQALLASHPDASDPALLTAHLLDVERHGGNWSQYCQTLPARFPEHPLFFSASQLQELQGSYALRVIQRGKARQLREYHRLCESITTGQTFTGEAHARAWATVLTRRFDVRLDGNKTMAMIPFADLPDHDLEPNLHWSSESSRGFFLTAAGDIDADTPLTIRYWKQCNGLTLATYGFSLDENPNNVAELRFPDMQDARARSTVDAWRGDLRDGQRIFRVPSRLDDSRTRDMLSYLFNLVPGQGQALGMLKAACQDRLAEFSTTTEEDQFLLKKDDLPLWRRFIVRVRHDEKAVLQTLLSLDAQQLARVASSHQRTSPT